MTNDKEVSDEDPPSNEFAFNPDISFPNAMEGNNLINISKCPTDCSVTCGREYPGLRPARNGHSAFAFTTITGKSTPHMEMFYMVFTWFISVTSFSFSAE